MKVPTSKIKELKKALLKFKTYKVTKRNMTILENILKKVLPDRKIIRKFKTKSIDSEKVFITESNNGDIVVTYHKKHISQN